MRALGHPCEADLVGLHGDSCLDGKLGQKIGNDIVTVVDDPTMRGGYGAYPIDDEGLDVREKTLIKNGILTDYLNHRETAHHFGIEPNAGARAPGRVAPSTCSDVEHDDHGWIVHRY